MADFRDLIHALDDICNQEGYKKIGSWANLLLVLVAFVPGLGDIAAKLGKKGIKALGNSRILKKIMDLVGDNIIAPIAKEGGDITANVVKSIKLTILDLLDSAKDLARQLGAEVDGAIDNLIGQERLRLQTVGEGAGNVNVNQPMQTRGTTNNTTTTVGRTARSFVGREYSSLTSKELAELKKNYEIRTTDDGKPTSIRRKKGEVAKGTPQLHIEEVDGKYIIKEGPASGSQRLSNANTMKNNYKKANGGTIPKNHQLHRIIPDAVVRENELAREAYDRRIFDLDRASNLQALPDTADAYNQANTPLLHRGSHKEWNDYVKEVLNNKGEELLDDLGVPSVKEIPDNILKQAIDEIEQDLKDDLLDLDLGRQRGWIKDSKEGLDKLSENESDNNIQSA